MQVLASCVWKSCRTMWAIAFIRQHAVLTWQSISYILCYMSVVPQPLANLANGYNLFYLGYKSLQGVAIFTTHQYAIHFFTEVKSQQYSYNCYNISRACARGKVIGVSAQKRPDLDFQALLLAVMATKLSKIAKNGLVLARNWTTVATRATIVPFVFATLSATPSADLHTSPWTLRATWMIAQCNVR